MSVETVVAVGDEIYAIQLRKLTGLLIQWVAGDAGVLVHSRAELEVAIPNFDYKLQHASLMLYSPTGSAGSIVRQQMFHHTYNLLVELFHGLASINVDMQKLFFHPFGVLREEEKERDREKNVFHSTNSKCSFFMRLAVAQVVARMKL